jgi:protein TonB
LALQIDNGTAINSGYRESSRGHWICSVIISLSLHLAIFLSIMLREPQYTVRKLSPLMELQNVILEEKAPVADNPPKRIQPKQKESKPAMEKPAEEITTSTTQEIAANTTQDVPVEISPTPVRSSNIPAAPSTSSTIASGQPQRIANSSELDNTEFEPLYNPKPDYPAVAQAAGITGYVDVDLTIDENGKVSSFDIVKTHGHPSFALETAKVLPRWRFPPPRIGGKKVSVQYVYRVNFTLR